MADDYMSDALLPPDTSAKVPKSLQKLRDRRHGPQKQQPLSQLQSERREEALAAPIPKENKGFQLLSRMGYRPGTGLGKAETGPTEAIPLTVKRTREGLGGSTDRYLRGKAQRVSSGDVTSADQYRQQLHSRFASKQLRRDFHKFLEMCADLDTRAHRVDSLYLDRQTLQQVARAQGTGPCSGCGYRTASGLRVYVVTFQPHPPRQGWLCLALRDLRQHVIPESELVQREFEPGDAAKAAPEAHIAALDLLEQEGEGEVRFSDEDINYVWPLLRAYLRDTYHVCVYCCAEYASAEELAALCPGPTKEDHEKDDEPLDSD